MDERIGICEAVHPETGEACQWDRLHVDFPIYPHGYKTGRGLTQWRDDGKAVCRDCLGRGSVWFSYRTSGVPTSSTECLSCAGLGYLA